MYYHFVVVVIVVSKDSGLSNKKVSVKTLKRRCCVGTFYKMVRAHLGAPSAELPDRQRHFQDPAHVWLHGICSLGKVES